VRAMSRGATGDEVRARLVVALLAVASAAQAEPDLRVHGWPAPRHLHMRRPAPRRAVQAAPAPAPAADEDDGSGIPAPLRVRAQRAADLGIAPEDSATAVHARLDLGFQVDGAQPTDGSRLAANVGDPTTATHFAPTLAYAFGDVYLGSHGLILPSLSSYLAVHTKVPFDGNVEPPISQPYLSRENVAQVRSAWAESDGLFESKLLAPIRVRAGRQYVYGPAPAHLDGFLAGWETRILRLHLFAGTTVPEWLDRGRESVTGADARLDLDAWMGFPAVVDASHFHWGASDHEAISASVTRGSGLYLRGGARILDGHLAHENVSAHVRISDVTRITAELDHHSTYDWRWDPAWVSWTATDPTPGAAKRYLELGPVGRRGLLSVRAGTVLLENIDLLARFDGALDETAMREHIPDTSFAASWWQVGAAFELRLRRAVAVGSSFSFRDYLDRTQWCASSGACPLTGNPGATMGQPLPPSPALGEQSMYEGGVTARYSSGARKLSASAELYGRIVRWHLLYNLANQPAPDNTPPLRDLRAGGRVSLEAWITPRFRLRVEYELSGALQLAPEIIGYKSLRILAEGSL